MTLCIDTRYLEIAGKLPGYEARVVQQTMVKAVYHALQQHETLVVEAGTGAGKSFGYLIPALLTEQRPIVISTGTIALQEQLIEKDIPFLAEAMGLQQLHVRLVKGRRNYVCLQKLLEFEKTLSPKSPERLYVNVVKSAFDDGWDGDKATLDMAIPPEIWEEMQSDSEDCLGTRCQFYRDNPYRLAREDLEKADILVVNHALYCQDLMSGQALLPPHDSVIFDEAHQLKSFATRSFTARIGKYATQKLLRKIHRRLRAVPPEFHDALYQTEAKLLEWLFRYEKTTFKLQPDELFFSLIRRQVTILTELRAWLGDLDMKTDCEPEANHGPEDPQKILKVQREKLLTQLDGLAGRWEYFLADQGIERVNWAEVNFDRLYYEIKSTPLNIAEQLKTALWQEKTAVLTSATLSTNQELRTFRAHLGLPAPQMAPDLILDSPFDYARQCELYLPTDLPEPNDILYGAACAKEITAILQHTQGRAFVLFTSYTAMQAITQAVIPTIPYPCKMQGDLPKNRLVEWFKTTPHSVLFATATFWEGIDIPGEALSCVIIDKLPFALPDEPINQAMVERLKKLGQDWFNGYVLPEATIRLKQGVGRLIRTKTDKGLVAILDPRLQSKGYGKRVIRSLPPAQRISSLAQSHILHGASKIQTEIETEVLF